MFNIANLPAVRAQLERDAAATTEALASPGPEGQVEYARAPTANGPQPTGGRPPATQGTTR